MRESKTDRLSLSFFRRNRRALYAQLHMNPVLALSPRPSFNSWSRSYHSINILLFADMFCVYVRKYTCTLFPLLPPSLLSCLIGRPSSGHSPPHVLHLCVFSLALSPFLEIAGLHASEGEVWRERGDESGAREGGEGAR